MSYESLTFDEYQERTADTAIYPGAGTGSVDALAYVALGLVGEAGEIANKVKKILRDSGGEVTFEVREALTKEVGDVTWYLARLAEELLAPLGGIAQANLNKLSARKEAGTLQGSGDNR